MIMNTSERRLTSKRSPDERCHDGHFATLREVIEHDNSFLSTNIRKQQKLDLVEYLKSL